MNEMTFKEKWDTMHAKAPACDEQSLFVKPGREPETQRQLHLYNHFQYIRDVLEAHGAKDVLEIGCGRGTMSLYLAAYCDMNLTLLDSEESAIAIAKQQFQTQGLEGTFVTQSALDTDFPDESFDAIVSIGLAEHLDDVALLLKEQYRLLKPGGVMISLNVPKKVSVQHLNLAMRWIRKLTGSYKDDVKKDYYRNTYTAEQYALFAHNVGFRDVTVAHETPFPIFTPISMLADKRWTKVWKGILGLRGMFMTYPFQTNRWVAQAHFLVGTKPTFLETEQSQDIWEHIKAGTFIIAEAGKNFIQTEETRSVEEYLANAKQLVDEAVNAGAHAIKWQTHTVEDEQLNLDITSPHFKGSDRYSWVKRNEDATPLETFWRPLKAYCEEKGICFMSTPMSRGAAHKLDQVGVDLWKIGSGDILDFVLLDYLRNSGKPIIFSTGMSSLEEAEKALAFIREKNDKVCILHCVSKYPCPVEDLRLGTIEFYKKHFDAPIGFSDHSIGKDTAVLAAALGAKVIEKHFSMGRNLWGADHKVSMTPDEFTALVKGIEAVNNSEDVRSFVLNTDFAAAALSNKEKTLQEGESVFRPLFRKALMAGADIPEGTIITKEMLFAMRPQQYAGGLPSEEYENVIGKKVTRPLSKFDPITSDILA